MLISFSIENWQSFRDNATLSMVASREKQHSNRIAKIDKYDTKLLPIAAIYGANASGKTKLFNALQFAQIFITRVTQPESPIQREYFKLDKKCATQPSKFSFELFIDKNCYEFSFSVTDKRVIEEKLTKILATTEKTIYHRENGKEIQFNDTELQKDNRLKFVAEGTRENQLFLTNSIDQKIDYFKNIYNWFKHQLVLIAPQTRFIGSIDIESMSDALAKLDTGINHIYEKQIPFETLQFPEEVKLHIMGELSSGKQIALHTNTEERILISKKEETFIAKKLVFCHKSFDGEDIELEPKNESAGTLRIVDLQPAFKDLRNLNTSKTYFIDELDRCFHTLLTKNFISTYLQSCSKEKRSQLIFTTHDVLLMDQDLLRRDEIWITEKDQKGCSLLTGFAEYKDVRADKDIRKSYLKGHLGGIPKILMWHTQTNKPNNKKIKNGKKKQSKI